MTLKADQRKKGAYVPYMLSICRYGRRMPSSWVSNRVDSQRRERAVFFP